MIRSNVEVRGEPDSSMKYKNPADELWIKNNAIGLSISAIAFCDTAGKVFYVNKAFLSLWRYDDEADVVGRNASDFWCTDGYSGAAGRTLKEKGGWIGEINAFKKDSSEFTVQVSISILTGTDNRPACYVTSFIDISERVAARHEQARILRRITERVKELDCILSIVTCKRLQSDSMEELLRKIVTLVQSSMQWPDRACARIVAGNVDVTTANFVHSDSMIHIPLGCDPTGFIDIGYTGDDDTLMILDEEKNLFFAVAREIESIIEQDRTEKELQLNRERLLQADKLASIGVLSAGIIHEIGNPNNYIALNARMLSKAWTSILPVLESYFKEYGNFSVAGLSFDDSRSEIPKLIDGILEGSDRIRNIGVRLRSFVQSSPQHTAGDIDVNSVVEHALMFVRDTINASTKRFSTNLAPSLPVMAGDPQQIEQVIINLLTNACQALRPDDGAITISTAAGKNNTAVIITVKDNGVGIDQKDIPRLTDPFFSTKQDLGGTGLGLSVSNDIVTRHGGTMSISSGIGKGTTVRLTFPGAKIA